MAPVAGFGSFVEVNSHKKQIDRIEQGGLFYEASDGAGFYADGDRRSALRSFLTVSRGLIRTLHRFGSFSVGAGSA
jgi:hypothetical protein